MEKKLTCLATVFLTLVFIVLVAVAASAQPPPLAASSFQPLAQAGPQASGPPTVQVISPAMESPSPAFAESAASAEPIQPEPAHAEAREKSVFETPVLGELVRVASSREVIATGNAFFCSSGRLSECGFRSESDTQTRGNTTVFYPFEGMYVEWFDTGCAADADDKYALENYDLSSLVSCAQNASDVLSVFSCASAYSWENDVTCAGSASAFKIAFCSSPLASGNNTFKLFKAFVQNGFNGHRFILFENENGFYSLDPSWCPPSKRNLAEECILSSSKNFYSSPEAKNYRGGVRKIDRIA